MLLALGIPGLMTIPFYFFNKYLQKKINPRDSGKNLLLYLAILLSSLFIYMTIGIYLIVGIAKVLK